MLPDKVYEALRWLVAVFMPALGVFFSTLAHDIVNLFLRKRSRLVFLAFIPGVVFRCRIIFLYP